MNFIKNMVTQMKKKRKNNMKNYFSSEKERIESNMQISGGNLEYNDKNEKNKKLSKIILVFIILVFIAIIAIICTIIYIQKSAFRVYVDGALVNMPERYYNSR